MFVAEAQAWHPPGIGRRDCLSIATSMVWSQQDKSHDKELVATIEVLAVTTPLALFDAHSETRPEAEGPRTVETTSTLRTWRPLSRKDADYRHNHFKR